MTHLDQELFDLKKKTTTMWNLVISQFEKANQSFHASDKDLAYKVLSNEVEVNQLELSIDQDCENIFALYSPVAVDLRFVLAILKINNNLERSGDIAEGIANFIISSEGQFDNALIETTQFNIIFEEATSMLRDVLTAFQNEDTKLAMRIFQRDEMLDVINQNANKQVAAYIRNHPDKIEHALYVLSIIRKLERVGDQCKNMAEEIIFYIDAKVLKHKTNS